MKGKYPWPASLLDEGDMEILFQARQKTGKPMTSLIKEAVRIQFGKEADEKYNRIR